MPSVRLCRVRESAGLIRSLGGWSEVKKMRLKGMDRIKGDERILGDSDFVLSVLSQANERFERRYELKRRGDDMTRVAERVAGLVGIAKEETFQKGRQKKRSDARGLFCYWCASELVPTSIAVGMAVNHQPL